MRILAALAEDEILINVFKKGEDVHASVAALVFGVRESEVTKDMREESESHQLRIVYGMGVQRFARIWESNRAEAQEFYNNYFRKFPRSRRILKKSKKKQDRKDMRKPTLEEERYFEGMLSRQYPTFRQLRNGKRSMPPSKERRRMLSRSL